MSVNRPTIPAVRDQDIANKLRLYGIFTAFGNGKVPNNKQIDIAMNSALASKGLSHPSTQLSEEGRHLIRDLKDVIEQAKILLLTKNHDQVIQEFIWHTQQATQTTSAATPNAPVSKDKAQEDGQQALAGLRTLGTLIITNGQFRKLLSDAQILLKDVASDAAQKAGGKIQPSEHELQQMDKPAEDNTWHEAPDLSKDRLKNQAKETYHKNKPVDRQQMKESLGDASQAANPDGSRDPNAAADRTANDAQTGNSSGVDHVGGAKAGLQSAKDKIVDGIPQEHKDNVNDKKDRTKNYMKDKMPEERRDQVIYRLKKMVVEIQGHQDYNQAIDTLLYLAESYTGHTKSLSNQTIGTVKQAHGDTHLQSAEKLFKTIIERFANYTSSDDLIDSINDIYRDADNDPKLKEWFRKVDRYVRRCLKEQGYILKDSSTDEYNQLYDEGNFLLRDRYRDHTDRILDEFKFMGDQFAEDPLSQKFGNSVQKLFLELGNDENGKPVFKKHLVKDLTQVILPGFFENVRYVPIPRIEYTDPMMDAIVENLIIESDNLMPNVLEVGNDSYFRWGRKSATSKNRQAFMVSVSGIQCDLKDVSYYVKKKSGFPHLTDTGVMDIFMGGEGFSFKLKLASAEGSDKQNFFKVDKVDVNVKHLNIKLKKSKHKMLFAIFKPLLLTVLRPVIQKVLELQIKNTFTDLDSKLYSIKKEADKAEEDLKNNPDPENAKNIYSRYASAAQKQFTQKKEKAEDIAADKHANVALTKEDSMFKNISLPGGVSTKATEFKQMAREGDRWESPVFGLGSAAATSNFPRAQEITRKPHNTRRAQVKSHRDSGFDSEQGYSGTQHGQSGNQSGYTAGQTGYGSGVDSQSQSGYSQGVGSGSQSYNQGVGSGIPSSQSYGQGVGSGIPSSQSYSQGVGSGIPSQSEYSQGTGLTGHQSGAQSGYSGADSGLSGNSQPQYTTPITGGRTDGATDSFLPSTSHTQQGGYSSDQTGQSGYSGADTATTRSGPYEALPTTTGTSGQDKATGDRILYDSGATGEYQNLGVGNDIRAALNRLS